MNARHLLLLCFRESAKAAQLGLFDAGAAAAGGGDPSRGGQLVQVVRVHKNGRRVRHWIRPGEAGTFSTRHEPQPIADVSGREGELAASRIYEMKADVSRIWRMEAESAYSGLLPVVAVREAAQNGIDAVRKAMRQGQVSEGVFAVTWDRDNERIVIEDNGVGMDRDTLQEKFLTLGATGKGADSGAVGGFGVAKAAILGSPDFENGGSWEIRTRDIRLTNEMLGRDLDPGEDVAEPVQGVRITLNKPQLKWSYRGDFEKQTIELLASSDIGKGITAKFNGKAVRPMWQGLRGKKVDLSGIEWPEGTKATITRIKVPEGANRQGRAYIRTGGLTQWVEEFYAAKGSPHDYVIDLEITARPGTKDYPLAKSRQAFQGQAYNAWVNVKSSIENELQADDSQKREQEIELFEVDKDGRIRTVDGQQGAALVDEQPEDIADVIKGLGGAEGLKGLAELAQSVSADPADDAGVTSISREHWGGSVLGALLGAVEQAGGNVDLIVGGGTTAAQPHVPTITADELSDYSWRGEMADAGVAGAIPVRIHDGPRAGEVVHVGRHPHELDRRHQGLKEFPHTGAGRLMVSPEERQAIYDLEGQHGEVSNEDATRIEDTDGNTSWVYAPRDKIAEMLRDKRGLPAPTPAAPEHADEAVAVSDGRRKAGAAPMEGPRVVKPTDVRGFANQVATGIPFVIHRNRAAWNPRRKLNMKKLAPHLIAWDTAVRAVANAYGIRDPLKTGLCLDGGAGAMHKVDRGAHAILFNPDYLDEQAGPKVDPQVASVRLHNLISHELAHNRFGQHDEDYVSHADNIRDRTAHVVPVLQEILERCTGRKGTNTREREKLQREVEKAKSTAKQVRDDAKARVRTLESEVKRLQAELAAAKLARHRDEPMTLPPAEPEAAPAPKPAAAPAPQPPAAAQPSQMGLFGGETPAGQRQRGAPRRKNAVPEEQIGFAFKGGVARLRLPPAVVAVTIGFGRRAA